MPAKKYGHPTYTYCILFKSNEESSQIYGKIGRTANLLQRIRTLQIEQNRKVNILRSIYICSDIEDLLLDNTKEWLHSGREFRYEEGIIFACNFAKLHGHQIIELSSYFRAIKEAKKFAIRQKQNQLRIEQIKLGVMKSNRQLCIECQHNLLPHPKNIIAHYSDWTPLKKPTIRHENWKLFLRLTSLKATLLKSFLCIIDLRYHSYFKLCHWDWKDSQNTIYGWYQWCPTESDYRKHSIFSDSSNLVASRAIVYLAKFYPIDGLSTLSALTRVLPLRESVTHSQVRRLIKIYRETKFTSEALENRHIENLVQL